MYLSRLQTVNDPKPAVNLVSKRENKREQVLWPSALSQVVILVVSVLYQQRVLEI